MAGDDPALSYTRLLPADPVSEAYKDIDRTLLRESLKRTPEARFRELMKLPQFAEELQAAGRRARRTARA